MKSDYNSQHIQQCYFLYYLILNQYIYTQVRKFSPLIHEQERFQVFTGWMYSKNYKNLKLFQLHRWIIILLHSKIQLIDHKRPKLTQQKSIFQHVIYEEKVQKKGKIQIFIIFPKPQMSRRLKHYKKEKNERLTLMPQQ
ncbi:hypothetical protein pb186bvf_020101 [Paramecium bursaria]